MNDYKKIMRVHESEDKDIRSLVTVVETDYMLQHLLGPIKKKTYGLIGKRLIRHEV